MKNARLSRIGADMSRRQPTSGEFEAARVLAFAAGVDPSRTNKRKNTTAKPSKPAPMNAPRQPHELCIINRLAGATAEPAFRQRCATKKPGRCDPKARAATARH